MSPPHNDASTKVAFLIRSLNYGGAERQLVTLAVGLHRKGRQVVVLVFYSGGPLEAELREQGVPVRLIGKEGRWDVARFLRRLLRAIQDERPDILHSYLDVPNVLAALLRPTLPGVKIVWGVRASNMDLSRYDRFSRVMFHLTRRLSRIPDLIITNSRAGAEYHRARGFPRERVVVVPNGIDTDRFRPDAAARASVRAGWGVGERDLLVGVVGRLDPMKDHPTLLRAASLLCGEVPEARFVVLGDGPPEYRRALQQLTRELGIEDKVGWYPARASISQVYSALDLLCSASRFGEGFPNVVGEAMASGTPCVVTDVGDSAWVVGPTGLVASPGDARRLAASLREGARRYAGGWPNPDVRARIVNSFSVPRLVDRTEEVLWK